MPERDQAQATELLLRMARGDGAAFEQLYDVVSGMVFGLVRRVLIDQAQSEEVFQEVMLDVWRNASRFDPGHGKAKNWIMAIAHRHAVDRVRSAQPAVDEQHAEGKVPPCPGFLTEPQRESVLLAYCLG